MRGHEDSFNDYLRVRSGFVVQPHQADENPALAGCSGGGDDLVSNPVLMLMKLRLIWGEAE